MSEGVTSRVQVNIPRVTAMACLALGAAVIIIGLATGHAAMGFALGLGMLIGGGNGFLAQRFLDAGVSFTITSLARLVVLTAGALVVGMVVGFGRVYLILGGLAISQFVLVAVAFSARRQQ